MLSLEHIGPIKGEDVSSATYSVVTTTVSKDNTVTADLYKANVWIIDYLKEYEYQKQTDTGEVDNGTQKFDDEDYKAVDSSSTDSSGGAQARVDGIASTLAGQGYTDLQATVTSVSSTVSTRTRDKTVNVKTRTVKSEYTETPAKRRDKIDLKKQKEILVAKRDSLKDLIDSKEVINITESDITSKLIDSEDEKNVKEMTFENQGAQYKIKENSNGGKVKYELYRVPEESEDSNFVKLLIKNKKARKATEEAAEVLFSMIETNEPDMLDLTKYLVYVAINRSYNNVTDYNFETFIIGDLETVSGEFVGDSFEEKVWFALTAKYSKIAVAGAMGNFMQESGFRANNAQDTYSSSESYDIDYTEKVNNGTKSLSEFMNDSLGYGLAQWTYPTRKQGLYELAKKEGTGIDDEDTQIKYLLQEIEQYCHKWQYCTNVRDAAVVFHNEFEMSNDDANALSHRADLAEQEYEKWKDKERPASSGGNGDILSTCREVMNDLLNHHVKYTLENLTQGNIKASSDFSRYGCCCATYVSVVLYKSGAVPENIINKFNYNYTGTVDGPDGVGVNAMMKAAGWKHVSESEAKAGDVCVYPNSGDRRGHAFIYAGGNNIWDERSGCISSSNQPPVRGMSSNWNYYISNHNVDVWRKP